MPFRVPPFAPRDDTKPKVEYYHRYDCPPSKFRGPFDRDHQKRLAAWSFDGAMVTRTRSLDNPLSPCATCEQGSDSDTGEVSPDDDGVDVDPGTSSFARNSRRSYNSRPNARASLAPPRPFTAEFSPHIDSGSQSSTVVDPDSYTASMKTLLPDPYEFPANPIAQLKESIRYASPDVRRGAVSPAVSPCVMSPRGKGVPFSPEDLTRALNAVQLHA
ncbi:hypothetical protein NUU61_008343 [Penicillium alfredii]|uniref:Uncharacterized protein n=1 Tax=Penicillium alfredii TaxID=1506179 RepID=A0A9W9ESA2_9EURO|nr:uncharacterized protein NUU61_008343 [Penicillium alfredii]KAJ5087036.1 hypothetical protein NUU61_008343 [Penicillium alfredii]